MQIAAKKIDEFAFTIQSVKIGTWPAHRHTDPARQVCAGVTLDR